MGSLYGQAMGAVARRALFQPHLRLVRPQPAAAHRLFATTVDTHASSGVNTSAATPLPRLPRRLRIFLYGSTSLLVGFMAGALTRDLIVPPLPAPGTPEDTILISQLRATADTLPIVQSLRSDKKHKWREWDAYSSIPPIELPKRLTTGPMGGARGLAVQKVFWNEEEQKAITVVFFGGALCGWPGIVHGGALATVMDESLGRAAIMAFPAKSGWFQSRGIFIRVSLRKNES